MDKAICIEDVTYRRGELELLKKMNWQVKKGEHWAILGLNGSGKTTLLNVINGYIWPTTGKVSVLENDFGSIDLRELRKEIGWVSSSLQEKLYANDKSEYIVVSGKFATIGLYEKPSEEDWERASQLMKQLGCAHLAGRAFQTCSQGEKQKLLIARALMASPKLLILDEPCNGLDLFSRERLLEAIAQLAGAADAPTLLYVTHHTEEILPIFQHVLLLRRGEVFQHGVVGEVLTSAKMSHFFESQVEVIERGGRIWVLPQTE
ncbi:ABC transporter ATP-binding protein [Paenibacillus sp. N3.4]|uniref:ABC transporter ATP-binding protein n=1 Tax=Paenibacillus sp. N3.4 TaxID=2603222 RepID=UPI0011C8BC80|nr:ABC transporter ATP-binding protein [Paenibacillus sp. N3.4]TXK75926.1 ABC transporter ATP-binding protein [Paenibacillus sp. N3.4]